MEDFLARTGEALVQGHEPERVWAQVVGVLRVAGGAAEDLDGEWRLVGEVLASACEALEAEPAAADQVARAVEAARAGAAALTPGRKPPALLVVHQRGGFRPRGAPYDAGRR
ncbi:MAG: hypothetical protein QM767_24975 [Anaeromyxobacter sp.]